MRKLVQLVGTIGYYIGYPYLILMLHGTNRSRVIIQKDEKILVEKMWLRNGKWFLPGGGNRKNESPGQGAAREVFEETGIKLNQKDLEFKGEYLFKHFGFKYTVNIYTIKLSGSPALKPRWFEVGQIDWIEPSKLTKKTASSDLLFCLKNCYNKDYV